MHFGEYLYLFHFYLPNIVMYLFIFFPASIILISFTDRTTLYCSSKNLIEAIEKETAFCSLGGKQDKKHHLIVLFIVSVYDVLHVVMSFTTVAMMNMKSITIIQNMSCP